MFTATVSAVLLLASSVGALHCSHDKRPSECTICAEETPAVLQQITRLESCSGWMARRKAARALRKYDWRCHPEAAEALADALMNDDCGLVRQEAAESLAKMRPCLPEVHAAVARAAKCDSSLLTRCWAKKALKSLGKACVETCSICGPGSPGEGDAVSPLVPGTVPMPMDSTVKPLPPTRMIVPRTPSGVSPFNPGVNPPLPSPTPEAAPLPMPGPDEGPALESPALSGPAAFLGGRPNLGWTLLGSDE